jgi:hypothetical protein
VGLAGLVVHLLLGVSLKKALYFFTGFTVLKDVLLMYFDILFER